ncbi:3-hydroxyanthranilate 3,4-dioxygenase [Trichoderma arundinaceum]|uniref:3-hydroxyanthranilate 3,4-dioxygenase n=1 Tax=Trichoderma arundinaceum TaxID=490622 RepID=A0A395NEZ8_TRIAR|nr:3-hydroxyanthranilate 3,4-dioxygenase [Trichoderma arundinaceum]
MNTVELAFSAALHGPNHNTNPDGPEVRRRIHEDKALCKYILGTVQAHEGALSIQESQIAEAGSGLFTTRDLKEGELIFTSVPLVLCGDVGKYAEACDFCFQQRQRVFHPVQDRFLTPGEHMPPVYTCKGCNLYQYCSQRAWDTGHLYECDLVAGTTATDIESRTLYRLLILMRKKVLLPEQVRALARLENEEARFEERAKNAWPLVRIIAQEAKERTKNLAGSLLNHCCEPNVVIIFNSTKVEVRAMKNLKAGEELLHCYRDISYDFTFRNPRLTARYQFVCQCMSTPYPTLISTIIMCRWECKDESDRHYKGAKEKNDVVSYVLSTQTALFDIIDEAKRQAHQIAPTFDIVQQLANVDRITKAGYAGRPWPDDLEPLPMVLKSLAALCERQGDLVNCVKIRVRALAHTRNRKSLPWSEDLIDFVMGLSTFTMFPNHPAFRDRSLPKNKEFRDIFIGHLHALHAILVKFYGEQGRTTKIVRKFMEVETSNYYGAAPTTRAFRRKFKTSQETILKWAGVDEKLSESSSYHSLAHITNARTASQPAQVPPINNYCVYNDDFTVMIVGGPNARTDYHINQTPEWFYQYRGAMMLKVVDGTTFRDIIIREGDMFLLPANTPHNPVRFANTVGVVLEQRRPADSIDRMRWYCAPCSSAPGAEAVIVHEAAFHCTDLGTQIKQAVEDFKGDEQKRTCRKCGTVADWAPQPGSIPDPNLE